MAMTTERNSPESLDDEPIDEVTQTRLQQQLLADRGRLHEELRRENEERVGSESFSNPSNSVPDAGDASVASEQADLRYAQMGRDVTELRQIEAALARMEDGSYGVCSQCGVDIAVARLRANPSAERCIVCQASFEKQYADPGATAITRKV